MKVLSLSDGISALGHILNNKLGVDAEIHSSEIDPWAMAVAEKNNPNIKQLGNMKDIDLDWVAKQGYDMVVGGPPCQDFSRLGARKGLPGAKGELTQRYINLLQAAKPKHFLMENVSGMNKESRESINELLAESGYPVKPVSLDAKHFNPVTRDRQWWTNTDISDWPNDIEKTYNITPDNLAYTILNTALEEGMTLKDLENIIVEHDPDKGWISITPKLGTPLATMGRLKKGGHTLHSAFARGTEGTMMVKRDPNGQAIYDLNYESEFRNEPDVFNIETKYRNRPMATSYIHPTANKFGSARKNLLMTPKERYTLAVPTEEQYEMAMGFPVGYTKLSDEQQAMIAELFRQGKVDPDFVKYAGKPTYDRYHMIGNSWAIEPATYILAKMLGKDPGNLVHNKQYDNRGRRVDSDERIKNIVSVINRRFI